MAEIGRIARAPMPAQVARIDRITRGVELSGEPRVAGAVLGEPVRDLHDRARAPVGQPASAEEPDAVGSGKSELPAGHPDLSRSPSNAPPQAQAGAPQRHASSAHGFLRAKLK